MIKDTTSTIYSCLANNFWLARPCQQCQIPFIPEDLSVNNYQLSFAEVVKVDSNCLSVTVQLTHKSRCLVCFKNPSLSLTQPTNNLCRKSNSKNQ